MTGTARTGKVAVIGAGLVGLAVARRLAQLGEDVTVFDKEDRLAAHQSGHNSGVVHAGLYYTPGSLKATLCRRGVGLLREFCDEHELVYSEIGKVVVAQNPREVQQLHEIHARAERNGVPQLRWLEPAELRDVEPHVVGLAALHSPTTAIVDYPAIAAAMAADIVASGGQIRLGSEITQIGTRSSQGVTLGTLGDTDEFDLVVSCAGLQSDLVARMAGDVPGPAIVPFRGEYYRLVPGRSDLVRGLVYPVPDPAYPFLGVHFTPRVDGSVDIGPNAVLATAREGYRRRDIKPGELASVLRWQGTRRLFRQHWRAGIDEMRSSISKRAFMSAAHNYVPELRVQDVVRAPAGVRAQAVDADGSLVDDFRINQVGSFIAVRNAPSPAATSCLAIAEHVVERHVQRPIR